MRTTSVASEAIMVTSSGGIKIESNDVWTDMKDQIEESKKTVLEDRLL